VGQIPPAAGTLNSDLDSDEGLSGWLRSYLPDTATAVLKVYVGGLEAANISTVSRLSRVFDAADSTGGGNDDAEAAAIKHSVFDSWDEFDVADLRVALSLPAPPAAREHGTNGIMSWMRQAAPNIAAARCSAYAASIDNAGVKTVNRLRNVVSTDASFLRSLGVDELDVDDITAAIEDYQVAQGTPVVEEDVKQGERCLVEWLRSNVPSLFLKSIEQYARLICQSNVVTVNRMIGKISADDGWLLSVLGENNDLDVADIVAVVASRPTIRDLVFLGSRKGRVFGIAESNAHIEFIDGGTDPTASLALVSRVEVAAKVCLDNRSIRTAVKEWISDRDAAAAKYGPIDSWNTSAVTDMSCLFKDCKQFNDSVNAWDVSNVTTMEAMFQDAAAFNQPLNAWNVNGVINMSRMFYEAKSFNQTLLRWDIGKVMTFESMFEGASLLTKLDDGWHTNESAVVTKMFFRSVLNNASLRYAVNLWCDEREKALSVYGPIDGWNTAHVTDMSGLFKDRSYFNDFIGNWNVSQVTDMSNMFHSATRFNQPLNSWNVSKVLNMSQMFYDASSFNQPLDKWDLHSVISCAQMFDCALSFKMDTLDCWRDKKNPHVSCMLPLSNLSLRAAVTLWIGDKASATMKYGDISGWNTSHVTDMKELFKDQRNFNDPIDRWDVSNVTDMSSMFCCASSFNQPLNSWVVNKVTNMSQLFYNAYAFNQPLNSWDVSGVRNMYYLFRFANSFNQPLNLWDVGNVTDMGGMFSFARTFNQALDSWNVQSVVDMSHMFKEANAFNRKLDKWRIRADVNMEDMFLNSAMRPPIFRRIGSDPEVGPNSQTKEQTKAVDAGLPPAPQGCCIIL
jgi:surface protein